MNPAIAKLVGSALEVLGTFLLAVEAIKIHNIMQFREKVLQSAVNRLNPKIEFVSGDVLKDGNSVIRDGSALLVGVFIVLGALFIGVALKVVGIDFAQFWPKLCFLVPGPAWVAWVVAVIVVLVLAIVSGALGTTVYTGIVYLFYALIAVLRFVENQTITGVIGMLGFLLFLFGATLKAYLDWNGP